MALRLHMKLGVVGDDDRAPDSPDTIVVVEPSVGARSRTKGNLYLLVTSTVSGPRAAEATRLAAETIQNEYYYDESAGIRVCLEKAVAAANKRLHHIRDRNGLVTDRPGSGPIGIGVAVVRDHEMYVTTVGPAEAYLIRGARLSTLPDPERDRGLPTADPVPGVWRGELSVGDSLVLASPNLTSRLGADELKDAMVTLHPQSAMEHLHHRFVLADGHGSDGAIAIEATEMPATYGARTLVAVRPAEPLAGLPDRSPIPLADTVTDTIGTVQAQAQRVQAAAGGAAGRLLRRVQDLMPKRALASQRVTPLSSRRDAQRRAAVAVLAFVVVVGALGTGIWLFGGRQGTAEVISSVNAGQAALDLARSDLDKVYGATPASGIDLVKNDPPRALQLLTHAHEQLAAAESYGVPITVTGPLRARAIAGLDDLYGMVDVRDSILFTLPENDPPFDLRDLVKGPDGAPYVLDAGTSSVYRIDLKTKAATVVLREGQKVAGGADAAAPKLIATGGPDLLVLDEANTLWRWRPADDKGTGTLSRIRVNGSASWGEDISGLGTYVRNASAGLYNLYVIDPSEEQILAYAPAADGSGYPAAPSGRLATARPVDGMHQLVIDGDIFTIDRGVITRIVSGRTEGWNAEAPGDELLRDPPVYGLIATGADRRVGRLYGWDPGNRRIIALEKVDGRYRAQYRLIGDPRSWGDIRGFFVQPGVSDEPDSLIWISADAVHQVVLEVALTGASPSPGAPSGSASPDGSPPGSASPAP